MPDTIANPYGYVSPIGQALAGLQRAMITGPTEAQRIYQAEQALKAKREREGVTAAASGARNYGTDAYDRPSMVAAAILGGLDPQRLATGERFMAANQYGATDPRTTNAMLGAGGAMGSTPAGFAISQNNEMTRFNRKPTTVGGPDGPVIVPQEESYGMPAVETVDKVRGDLARRGINTPGGIASLPRTEQRFIGAERAPSAPHNYVGPDGKTYIVGNDMTQVQTGGSVPQGGYIANASGPAKDVGLSNPVRADLQRSAIAQQRFNGLLDFTENLARKDPNNFGIPGMAKGLVQDANIIAGNLVQGLGYPGLNDAVNDVRQKAMASGVNPGLLSGVFDPHLPALHTASDLLVYSAAEALAGQNGRSVSDRDVKMFKEIVGDPRDWAGNQEKFLSKLQTLRDILGLQQGVTQQNLRPGGVAPATPAAPGAGASPAAPGAQPPAATAGPTIQEGATAINRQTGQRIMFRNGQWVPAQ